MATIYSSTRKPQWLQYLKLVFSQNTKCDNLVGFPKSGHVYKLHNTLLQPPSTFFSMESSINNVCSYRIRMHIIIVELLYSRKF